MQVLEQSLGWRWALSKCGLWPWTQRNSYSPVEAYGTGVMTPPRTSRSYIRVPGLDSQLWLRLRLPTNTDPGRQWGGPGSWVPTTHVVGDMPGFPVPGCGWSPGLFGHLGSDTQDGGTLSCCLTFSVSQIKKKNPLGALWWEEAPGGAVGSFSVSLCIL